jgi:site-specific DNA-methyltransferase (adenine-specific)
MVDLKLGNCLELMKTIERNSIDAIITDPPYGTTACKWDSVIDFKLMWEQLNRIIKPNGAIVLFGSEPFSSALRMSNIKNYKYDWIWEKTQATGHLNAKKQPLRSSELISLFYKKQCTYNPQKTQGHKPMNTGVRRLSVQNKTEVYGKATKELPFGGNTDRYPRTNIVFKSDKQTNYKHPTQKPIALMEYLIKTYTNENETVLDFTMGSGSTGVAAKNLHRNFIGIEIEDNYFNIAKDRINK